MLSFPSGHGYLEFVRNAFALSAIGLMLLTACAGQTVLIDNPPLPSSAAVQTFDAHGIRFDYPGTWIVFDTNAPNPSPSSGQPNVVDPTQESVDMVGLDDLNNVQIIYGLPVPQVATDDFGTWSARIEANLEESVRGRRQTLLSGPEEIQAAGYRAIRYEVQAASRFGYLLDVTWVGFLRGDTQFIIACQSLPDRTAEIQRGCQQILATLQVGIVGGLG
jgi:hypothetical protein